MAFLLCVANQKGGSGKTTTAINLAGGFTRAEYPVLFIDADPQESATAWGTVAARLPFEVVSGDVLRRGADPLLESGDYEVIIVDCPPGVADDGGPAGRMARAALVAADAILIPVRPSTLDLSSTASFVAYLAKLPKSSFNPGQRVLVVLNGVQRTLLSRQTPEAVRDLFSELSNATVLAQTIALRVPIAEAAGSGLTIFDYAPASEAAREYTELTQEVLKCLTAKV